MNAQKKPPAAPPAYRPQPLPKVLQRKAARIFQLAGPTQCGIQVAPVRSSTIQRAQAPAPQRGAGRSGRSPSTLWDLLCRYRRGHADRIENAFRDANYNINNMRAAILRAVEDLRLDLSAHGTGGDGDAVQGDLDADADNWVARLTAWVALPANQAGAGAAAAPGLRHNPQQEAAAREAKQERKADRAQGKKAAFVKQCKDSGKHYAPPGNVCKICGEP